MTVTARPLRVAVYARVSTRDKEQAPELQLQPLRKDAVARGRQPAEDVDRVAAGDLARRTAWARLLADARRRRGDHVLTRRGAAPPAAGRRRGGVSALSVPRLRR
jgi:DNA invertase Pin-like site-specific DNA recombinase